MISTKLSNITDNGVFPSENEPISDSPVSFSSSQVEGNSFTRKQSSGDPHINLWDEIQSISELTGKEYDAVFNSLLQCNMDKELVIKLHHTGKRQIRSARAMAHSTSSSEDNIQPPSESSKDWARNDKTIHRNEEDSSPSPRQQLEKQSSSISLDVQNSDSTLDLDYSLGSLSNDSVPNEHGSRSNGNMAQYRCNPSYDTTHGESPMQGSWASDQHSHISHPCYNQNPNHSPHQPHSNYQHPNYQQNWYPGGYGSVMVPNHTFGVAMGNNYAQAVYPMVHHPSTDRTHYEHHEQSAVELPANMQMDEVQSRPCVDSWFIPTYHAPAPIHRYWLVPAPFANVFHYGPSHFTMPEPPNTVTQ